MKMYNTRLESCFSSHELHELAAFFAAGCVNTWGRRVLYRWLILAHTYHTGQHKFYGKTKRCKEIGFHSSKGRCISAYVKIYIAKGRFTANTKNNLHINVDFSQLPINKEPKVDFLGSSCYIGSVFLSMLLCSHIIIKKNESFFVFPLKNKMKNLWYHD